MVELNTIFNISYGQKEYHSKSHLTPYETGVPLISSKGKGNGIYGYFDIEPKYNNVISVPSTGTIGYAIYQEQSCCIDDNCLVLEPNNDNKDITKNEMIYYASLIRMDRHKYLYGRQITPRRMGETEYPSKAEIPNWVKNKKLPDVSSIPDYFLKEGYDKACWYLDNVNQNQFERDYKDNSVPDKIISLNTSSWTEFKLDTLFNIFTGEDLIISSLNEGEFNVVSHKKVNNGVSGTTQEIEGRKLFDCEKTLSLADRGNFFATIQSSNFYIGTRVKALESKFDNSNKYKLMFLSTVINQEAFRFSYGRNCCNGVNSLTIKLPILRNNNGEPLLDKKYNNIPDFEYMENYIKSISFSKAI